MLNIRKGTPAPSARRRAAEDASWSEVTAPETLEMRRALSEEQHGLCAYCTRQVSAEILADGKPGSTIEHWHARANGGPHFEWSNLLLVCRGDLPGGPHCDKSRGDTSLTLCPADPRCDVEALVSFGLDGKAKSTHDADITTLNLNHALLSQGRRQVVDAVLAQATPLDLTGLRKMERAWSEPKERAAVALPLIRRRIRHLEGVSARTRGAH